MEKQFQRMMLDRRFGARDGVLGDFEIRLTSHSRLFARLLVSRNSRAMRSLFDRAILPECRANPIGPDTAGVVSPLRYTRHLFNPDRVIDVYDARYFSAIFLDAEWCTTEIVAHECGHAAIHYAKRCPQNNWCGRAARDDESGEKICYPLGRLFSATCKVLHDCGVWR